MKRIVSFLDYCLLVAVTMVRVYGLDALNKRKVREFLGAQVGAINTSNAVEVLVMIFIAFVILYQLIPWISNQNNTVQDSANVTEMGKFSAGLGEWLFPLFGILALVFLLWRRRSSKRDST